MTTLAPLANEEPPSTARQDQASLKRVVPPLQVTYFPQGKISENPRC